VGGRWLNALTEPVSDKLEDVGVELDCQLRSEHVFIDHAAAHMRRGVSKRLRPALLLLSAGLCGYRGRDDVPLAAAAELIHTATLVHDDVIDEAPIRRGHPSLNQIFGSGTAVLLGDFLFARALTLVQHGVQGVPAHRHRPMLELLTTMTLRMVEGQLLEEAVRGDVNLDEAKYLMMVRLKTGEQVAACCRLGAMLARSPRRHGDALYDYGLELGIAFQIVDDLIDLTLDEREAGKKTGVDLRRGNLTLAAIYLLRESGASERRLVESLIGEEQEEASRELRVRLSDTGALAAARDQAVAHAERARSELDGFAPSAFRAALERMPSAVLAQLPEDVGAVSKVSIESQNLDARAPR
jgi:octaprenyl-diphosphate synthase